VRKLQGFRRKPIRAAIRFSAYEGGGGEKEKKKKKARSISITPKKPRERKRGAGGGKGVQDECIEHRCAPQSQGIKKGQDARAKLNLRRGGGEGRGCLASRKRRHLLDWREKEKKLANP